MTLTYFSDLGTHLNNGLRPLLPRSFACRRLQRF